ncbi:MAG: DegT/DnrJ/EryC1/StrS family aminotransferase [Bryobacteraceae bacterium]
MNPIRFPFLRPSLPGPEQWTPYLASSYSARRYSNFGPANELFERRLENFLSIAGREAVACSSATSGLAAVLMERGVTGKVAIPSFTFPATVHAVLTAGCLPVVCDVDARTWELSPAMLESVFARHDIAAVIHVRAFGFCRDLQNIASVCAVRGVPLVVDAAAALGGSISPGVPAGGQGMAEVFSLHATKVFGIGEGGAIFCGPDDALRSTQALNFGLGAPAFAKGLNGKLSEFSAAIGLAVLDCALPMLPARAAAAQRYQDFFQANGQIGTPADPGLPPWQCFPALLPTETDVPSLLESARSRGLELRRYYHPALHRILPPEIAILEPAPVAEDLAARMVCFPIYPAMSEEEQSEILQIVKAVLPGLD